MAKTKPANDFVHLHLHTHYSILDSTNRIDGLMQTVRGHGQRAVAVTDHGNLFGAVQFYKGAEKEGIKPIIGCEVYVAKGKHTDKQPAGPNQKRNHHLVLLAENKIGFHNLIKLVSKAHRDGFYYRPRCDRDLLEEYSEGLLCLSACLSGEIASAVMDGDLKKAEEAADWHRQVFKDRYYMELQHNGLERQERVNVEVLRIAKRLKLPIVATNDCHIR